MPLVNLTMLLDYHKIWVYWTNSNILIKLEIAEIHRQIEIIKPIELRRRFFF